MRVRLLGTGSADGIPNPFCTCATCDDARQSGCTRASSSALVDDVIWIDPGPGAAPAAGRQATTLDRVCHVLITHGHPDHLAPEFMLWRSWIQGLPTLHVHGPAHAIARFEHWLSPELPVSLHVVQPGDEFTARTDNGAYVVRAIPSAHGHGNGDIYADEAVLYDITAPDTHRLLYATDTGPLRELSLEAVRNRDFTLVLIEETFGDRAQADGHLNIETLGSTLADLRASGAIGDKTDVIAFHLSHHNPPPAALAAELAPLGARIVDDGTVVDTGSPTPMHAFVVGGARSGKSTYAERLALRFSDVTYIATGGVRPDDPEWTARIAEHRNRRPAHWRTVESTDLVSALTGARAGQVLLIDCMGMWLTAQLDDTDAWSENPAVAADALAETQTRIDALLNAVTSCPANLLIVSNEVGQGVVPATHSGRLFRDLLGTMNARLSDVCTDTTFMVAGRALSTRTLITQERS